MKPDAFAGRDDDDELRDVRRPMLAAGPPVCLAGVVEAPAPVEVPGIHDAAVSAKEALHLYRASLESEHGEAHASKAERVAARVAEARAALQWLGGLFEAAGDSGSAWHCRRMAHLLVTDDDITMDDVEAWEAWLREAAEGHAEPAGGEGGNG